jgi:hypothetical protein
MEATGALSVSSEAGATTAVSVLLPGAGIVVTDVSVLIPCAGRFAP